MLQSSVAVAVPYAVQQSMFRRCRILFQICFANIAYGGKDNRVEVVFCHLVFEIAFTLCFQGFQSIRHARDVVDCSTFSMSFFDEMCQSGVIDEVLNLREAKRHVVF